MRENKLGFKISQLRAIEMKGLENRFPFVGSIPMHARERGKVMLGWEEPRFGLGERGYGHKGISKWGFHSRG